MIRFQVLLSIQLAPLQQGGEGQGEGQGDGAGHLGRAVQVYPIKPMLKPPGTEHLKCDELLSSFAFKFNLRRYTSGGGGFVTLSPEEGGSLRTHTRPTLNPQSESARLYDNSRIG